MFNWKYPLGILCALSLAATVPDAPAKAGGNGGAIAAGIVGAIGSAIIMNQIMQGAQMRAGTRPQGSRRAARPKGGSSGNEAHAKDPFAGQSAPAGYAKPVTESK